MTLISWGSNSPVWLAPLAAGGAYLIITLLAAHAVAALGRWLASRRAPSLRRLYHWGGWRVGGQLIGFIYELGFLTLALTQGWLAAPDVGLRQPNWAAWAAWGPPALALASAWLALLWGAGWWDGRPSVSASDSLEWGSLWELPGHALSHEAGLAILRAALLPWLGIGAGAWLSAALHGALRLSTPKGAIAARHPHRRPWLLLQLALDWLSTAVWILSGSIWPGVLARSCELLALLIWYGALRRRAEALQR